MSRFPGYLSFVAALVLSSSALSQTTNTVPPAAPRPQVPSGPAGAARPGMPARDPGAIRAPQTGTGRLRGRVIALETGTPLRRASVSILLPETQLRRVTTTDGEGRYEFAELPAGRFAVSATKGGYVSLQYGQRRPFEAGTPVVLADGQVVERVDVALPRGAVIAGRVTDEFGEPIASAQVQAMRHSYGPDGQRRPLTAGMATTDDRGEFRVFGLMPGEYVVNAGVRSFSTIGLATSGNDVNEGYPPTYYPGTINPAEAQTLSVAVGQEMSVHFSLLPARMLKISGSVVDSEGRAVAGAPVMLRSGGAGLPMMTSGGITGSDGAFTMSVAPGDYVIDVRPPPRAGERPEFASMPVAVGGGDVTGVKIVTGHGGTISGRVVFEGTAPRTGGPTPTRVFPQSVDPSQPMIFMSSDANGTVAEDGAFEIGGVTGKAYLTVSTPPAWTVKSISVEGEDITDVPLDLSGGAGVSGVRIVLTDKLTDISGQVTADRKPVSDYAVVILPEQPREGTDGNRLIRVVRPDTNGRFQLKGLRPGRYVATAIEALEQGRQFVPEFQERLRRSGRAFSVEEGGTATLSLELTAGL